MKRKKETAGTLLELKIILSKKATLKWQKVIANIEKQREQTQYQIVPYKTTRYNDE